MSRKSKAAVVIDRCEPREGGYGLEGVLTDTPTKIIIENSIPPRFGSGDLPSGVARGFSTAKFDADSRLAIAPDYVRLLRPEITMNHFVRFAKLSASGTLGRAGWRLRMFATSNEAGAFARQMMSKGWRVETGELDDTDADAPSAPWVERSLGAELTPAIDRTAVGLRQSRV